MIKILHIIYELSFFNISTSMIAFSKYSSLSGGFTHTVISLKKSLSAIVELAKKEGLTIMDGPNKDKILKEMKKADIVQFEWWNTPEMNDLLITELPEMRSLIWCHVCGDTPPQIITEELIDFSDMNIFSSLRSFNLPFMSNLSLEKKENNLSLIPDIIDYERFKDIKSLAHKGFNVGYIASPDLLNYKAYLNINKNIEIPDIKLIVSTDEEQSDIIDPSERINFYYNNKDIIKLCDVFSYPIIQNHIATSDLHLKEAMCAGISPVVFPYGSVKDIILHKHNGLIVNNELEYKEAIEYLYHNPDERHRLGKNAKDYAIENFKFEKEIKKLNQIYAKMMEEKKQKHIWKKTNKTGELIGAKRFIDFLGDKNKDFETSIEAKEINEIFKAEENIACSEQQLYSKNYGGILHYCNYYSNDPYLHLWAGLIFEKSGNYAQSVSEFSKVLNFNWAYIEIKDKNLEALSYRLLPEKLAFIRSLKDIKFYDLNEFCNKLSHNNFQRPEIETVISSGLEENKWRIGWYLARVAEKTKSPITEEALWKLYQFIPEVFIFRQLIRLPEGNFSGVDIFLDSIADNNQDFLNSMNSEDINIILESENKIASSLEHRTVLINYRNVYHSDSYLRLWTGLVLENLGDYEQALSEFTEAIKLGIRHWRINWYLARSAEKIRNMSIIEDNLKEVIEANPEFTEAFEMCKRLNLNISTSHSLKIEMELKEGLDKINFFHQSGNLGDAIRLLSELMAKYPDIPDLINYLGELKFETGNREEAKSILLNLIKASPDYPRALNNLGVIYWGEKNHEKAIEYFTRSMKINPEDRITVLNIGDILDGLKEYERLKRHYSNYLERNPDDDEVKRLFLEVEKKINDTLPPEEKVKDFIIEKTSIEHSKYSADDEKKKIIIEKMINLFGQNIKPLIDKHFDDNKAVSSCLWMEDNIISYFPADFNYQVFKDPPIKEQEYSRFGCELKHILQQIFANKDDLFFTYFFDFICDFDMLFFIREFYEKFLLRMDIDLTVILKLLPEERLSHIHTKQLDYLLEQEVHHYMEKFVTSWYKEVDKKDFLSLCDIDMGPVLEYFLMTDFVEKCKAFID